MKFQVRQGDVLVEAVDEIPKAAKPVKPDNGRTILAYGEVTGHAHALPGARAKLFRAGDETSLTSYLHVEAPAELKHDEHNKIAFVPGKYRVIQQRQWTMERQVRRVAD